MSKLSINGTSIALGETKEVRINVGCLPSGTPIDMYIHVYRARKEGPTMLLTGGIHGDEINGIEIVRRASAHGLFDNLWKGTVIAIPLVNIYGFINFSRDTPDGKDVNRSFPGISTGSLSSRVARTITKQILPNIDFGVDFHTGGSSRYNYPQIRFSKEDPVAKELAYAFGAPYLIEKNPIVRSFRKVAMQADVPILVYEGGESLRFDGISIQKGLEGLQRILVHKGMSKMQTMEAPPSVLFKKTLWVRASQAGIFEWSKCSGQFVRASEKIGMIYNAYGQRETAIYAKNEGYIIGHNNSPVVSLGDPLFHIGYEAS